MDVERLFSQYGPVARVDLKRGFAFVFMQQEQHGEAAIRGLDGKALDETRRRPLKVEWARGDGAIKRREDERRRRATDPSETLFVVNFDPVNTTRQLLDLHFSRFGSIVRLDLQQRFAFIQFEQVSHATAALQALNGMLLGDRYLIVEYTIRNEPSGSGRKRHRDRMIAPYGGPRSIPPREHFRRGRSPSPRGMYGRMSRDHPRGPPYPRERSHHLNRFRNHDPLPRRDGGHDADAGQGKYRDKDHVLRDREDKKRGTERFSEPRECDTAYHRENRSPSPARDRHGGSGSPNRGRSRSRSRSEKNRSVSREQKAENGCRGREQGQSSRGRDRSPYPRRRRKSRSRSRSPLRDRSRSRSLVRNRNQSRSPLRKRARSLSDERIRKNDGGGSRSRSRSFSPRHRQNKSLHKDRGRDRSRSRSLSPHRSPVDSHKPSRGRSRSRSYSPCLKDPIQTFSEEGQGDHAMDEDGILRNHKSRSGDKVMREALDKKDAAVGKRASANVDLVSPNGTSISPRRRE